METVQQIKEICYETNNNWFLGHSFPRVALFDLQFDEKLKKERNINMSVYECICRNTDSTQECIRCESIRCEIELERNEGIEELEKIQKWYIYNYETDCYIKSKWIIPEKIDGKIPGFMLIKCSGDDVDCDVDRKLFTHSIVFACVRPEHRKKGILKNMVNKLPKDWNIWLEASSKEIKNVEDIWKKCGFQFHEKLYDKLDNEYRNIYKRISAS